MRALRFFAPLAATLALLVPALAQENEKQEKRLFWQVTGDKGTIWLLGSIHIGSEDMYPLPPEIEKAYKASDALVVEADADTSDPAVAQKIQSLVLSKGMYKDDSVDEHLSESDLKKLKDYCEKQSVPFEMLKGMKPWLIALQLEGVAFQKMGLDQSLGIDRHFLKKAHKKGKKVIELESAESQIAIFTDMEEELQGKFLMSTIEEQEQGKKRLDAMFDAWAKGDAAGMDKIIHEEDEKSAEFKPLMKKLLDDRNVEMIKKIEGYLARGEKNFIIVGSAHMVGEKGIVKALESKKFKVEQVPLTKPEKKSAEKKEPEPSGAK